MSQTASFKRTRGLESFYTGGDFFVHKDKIFSACSGGVTVTDLASVESLYRIESEGDAISAFAVVDDRKVVTVGESGLFKLWDLVPNSATVKIVSTWSSQHTQPVTCLSVLGGLVVSGSMDKSVRVFDLNGKFCTHNFRGHVEGVSLVRFLSASTVASVGLDNVVVLWDLKTHSQLAVLKDHLARITDLTVDSVANLFHSVSSDQMLFSYPLSGAPGSSLLLGEPLVAVTANAALNTLAVATETGRIRLFAGSRELASVHASTVHGAAGRIRKLLWVSDSTLCSVGEDLTVALWSFNPEAAASARLTAVRVMAGHLGEITSVRLIESAGILLTVNDENVRVFDQNSMNMHVLVGHSDLVLCSAVAPSLVGLPGLVATGAKDQTVRVWAATEVGNWRCVLVLSGHTGPVSGLAFSRGRGNALMLASCSEDRTLKVWKIVDNGSPIWSTTITTTPTTTNTTTTTTTTSGGVSATTIRKAEFSIIVSQKKGANSVAFAPNDKSLAVGCQDKTVVLVDMASRAITTRLTGHRRGVSCVSFSPVERVLASASADGTVKLWNLNNGQCLRTLEDVSGLTVYNCGFLPSGQQVLGVCGDGTIRLWSVRTGDCLWTEADVHDGKIWGFDVSAAASFVTGDSNGKLAVFVDNTDETRIEESKKTADKVEKDTKIAVLVNANKFHQAATLAISLNRPGQFIDILEQAGWLSAGATTTATSSANGSNVVVEQVEVEEIMKNELSTEEGKEKVVAMAVRWISNARSAYLGQLVSSVLLKHLTVDELATIEGFNTFIDALTTYGLKHDNRVERLAQRLVYVEGLLKALHSVPLPSLDLAMGRHIKRSKLVE